jgi:type III secretion protein D
LTTLRILNGLKRGASIPLNEDGLLVGASFLNDIVMLDQGIADQHFEIKQNVSELDGVLNPGFTLGPINGKVTRIDGSIMKDSFILQKNEPFLVGDIWFVLHDKATAWPEQLPIIQSKINKPSEVPRKKSLVKEMLAIHPAILAGAFSVVCFIFLGFKNVSYATVSEKSNNDSEQFNEMTDELSELQQEFKARKIAAVNGDATEIKGSKVDSNNLIDTNNLVDKNNLVDSKVVDNNNPANTILALQKMLKDREINGVDIKESKGKLILMGEINDQHKDKLARMLERFRYENANSPEVVDKTTALALTLPFEIKAVVSGPYGHVRLNSGQKLLVGDSLSGYKLNSITDRTIVFMGKNKIEVNW